MTRHISTGRLRLAISEGMLEKKPLQENCEEDPRKEQLVAVLSRLLPVSLCRWSVSVKLRW